jgi:hypothetical protein
MLTKNKNKRYLEQFSVWLSTIFQALRLFPTVLSSGHCIVVGQKQRVLLSIRKKERVGRVEEEKKQN